MEQLQGQAATMKKLTTPSDDPVGASKVLEVRTDTVRNEQYARTGKMAESLLNHADHALEDLTEVLVRAKEIAINQSSMASSTDETRLGVAEEVKQLFNMAVAAGNTKVGERYLFGGYKTSAPPVNDRGEYQGDDGHILVEIAKDVFFDTNVPGLEVFNTRPDQSGDFRRLYPEANPRPLADNSDYRETSDREPAGLRAGDTAPGRLQSDSDAHLDRFGEENVNLFRELDSLRTSLLTGDVEGIRSTLERLDALHANVVAQRSKLGARVAGLSGTLQTLDRHNITNATLTSNIEDADMAQVLSDIAKEETVLGAVMNSSKKLVMPTLMEFLK